ncbi:hypothetical protein D3C72_2234220 [compost metagenome]
MRESQEGDGADVEQVGAARGDVGNQGRNLRGIRFLAGVQRQAGVNHFQALALGQRLEVAQDDLRIGFRGVVQIADLAKRPVGLDGVELDVQRRHMAHAGDIALGTQRVFQ